MIESLSSKIIWKASPLVGTLLFVILYVAATLVYPGGSQIDKHSTGFSWMNNYWCNLLNTNSINGQHNPARPIALAGTVILSITLALFWYHLPLYINFTRIEKYTIQISGILSMTVAMFLFTSLHDIFLNIASLFGLIAVIGTFIGLFKSNLKALFLFGIFNLLLVALNNYVYYTKGLILYLPVIQKISFASFLIWICSIDIILKHKNRGV